MADGIYWFADPYEISQKFSVSSDLLPEKIYDLVAEPMAQATQMMRETVIGLSRIKTGDMLASISHEISVNRKGRVQGYYGFILDMPIYTIFQEYGTRGRHGGMDNHVNPKHGLVGDTPGNLGIAPMHAFLDATAFMQAQIAEKITTFNPWTNFR